MRPINLIPVEERRGQQTPLRTGPLSYVVLGLLAAALIGIAMLVTTGNQIDEHKAEVASLKREDRAVRAQTERLAAYTQFKQLSDARVATVESLADSRFDWERVMRELALILPDDVWLTELIATASPQVSLEGGSSGSSDSGGSNVRAGAAGPALELKGCGDGQVSVARFAGALKDIDGVTRVAVEESALPAGGDAAGTGSAGEEGGSDVECRTRSFVSQFSVTAAFDAAPVPPTALGEEVATVAAEPETAESGESTGGEE